MARPWRDLITAEDLTAMLNDEDYMAESSSDRRKSLFKTRSSAVNRIGNALRQYHSSAKDDLGQIPVRVDKLQEINRLVRDFFVDFRVDPNQAAIRMTRTVLPVTFVVRNKQKSAMDESFDRNLLTLQNRSMRKARYLEELKRYCESRAPQDFIDYARGNVPQYRNHGELGVSDDNLAEVEDFAHRDGFHGGAISEAFEEWAQANTNKNFFLWLENHPICTSQDRTHVNYSTVKHVEYFENGQANDAAKFKILTFNQQFLYNGIPVDTYQEGYSSVRDKSIAQNNQFANGLAAYVWSTQNEVYVANHSAGRFHHSSLLAGGRVKCAGMIGIRNGLIEELSNNSGHYKPGPQHMRTFINFFRDGFAANASLKVDFGNQGDGYRGNLAGWQGGLGIQPRAQNERRPTAFQLGFA